MLNKINNKIKELRVEVYSGLSLEEIDAKLEEIQYMVENYGKVSTIKEAVSLILKNEEGKILGVSRKDNHELFGFIGGKKDDTDTSVEHAIVRECMEETGIRVYDLKLIDRRIYGEDEKSTYMQYCFVGKFDNEPLTNDVLIKKGEGVTKWLTEEEITCGFFGQYNRMMLDKLKTM